MTCIKILWTISTVKLILSVLRIITRFADKLTSAASVEAQHFILISLKQYAAYNFFRSDKNFDFGRTLVYFSNL